MVKYYQIDSDKNFSLKTRSGWSMQILSLAGMIFSFMNNVELFVAVLGALAVIGLAYISAYQFKFDDRYVYTIQRKPNHVLRAGFYSIGYALMFGLFFNK